ncbi:MAG: SAM-dependent chlorinase/fluorinase [Chitinophagaceae bacterium]
MDIFANEYTKNLTSVYLISDFQNGSYKIGLLKSAWMRLNPSVNIIDISNDIRLNNIIEAAFISDQLQLDKSKKEIVLIKVGYTRESVVYQRENTLYIMPNNGLIGMLPGGVDSSKAYLCMAEDENKVLNLFLNDRINELTPAGDRLEIRYQRQANIQSDIATAECIYTDHVGNCFFNIRKEQFEQFISSRNFLIRIQHIPGVEFKRINQSILEADQSEAIVRFSKSGYLKLQIRQGNAKQLFRIKEDTKIIIELK